MPHPNPYDELPYPNRPCPDTYPERLWPQGILRGMQPAPAGRCRLLELGCGTGINLVRRTIREMLLYHVRDGTTAAERLERTRQRLTFFAEGSVRPERFRQIIQHRRRRNRR